MSNPYIAQDVLDQCLEAIRQGKTLDYLAGHLHCDTEYLGRLLQLPTAKPAAAADDDSGDLWATDRLDGQL